MDGTKNKIKFEPFLDSNCKPMELNAQTKIGLTFGQILSLVSVTGMFVLGYANLEQKISDNANRISEITRNYQQIYVSAETNRKENREEHAVLMAKIDQILMLQKSEIR